MARPNSDQPDFGLKKDAHGSHLDDLPFFRLRSSPDTIRRVASGARNSAPRSISAGKTECRPSPSSQRAFPDGFPVGRTSCRPWAIFTIDIQLHPRTRHPQRATPQLAGLPWKMGAQGSDFNDIPFVLAPTLAASSMCEVPTRIASGPRSSAPQAEAAGEKRKIVQIREVRTSCLGKSNSFRRSTGGSPRSGRTSGKGTTSPMRLQTAAGPKVYDTVADLALGDLGGYQALLVEADAPSVLSLGRLVAYHGFGFEVPRVP